MAKPADARYLEFEKIVGRDPWHKVLWYRIMLIFVDTLSMASIFAIIMTVILYKSFRVFVYMIDKQVSSSVLITFIGMLLSVFAAFIFAYTYLCARKYTPPIVEALATRLSGGHDIVVPVENGKSLAAPVAVPTSASSPVAGVPDGVFTDQQKTK